MNIYKESTTNSLDFAMRVKDENDAEKFREYVATINSKDRFT